IKMYFGIGMPQALSLDEIAMKFGLTRERVRQIKEKGIKRLRVSSKSKHLQQYL
ncbi:MAG: RNA polymerase subunit sigma, partial [Bacteroidales bacterium]|nr:RNA polymerase subunit sigma [Bacteroidales bacterium]